MWSWLLVVLGGLLAGLATIRALCVQRWVAATAKLCGRLEAQRRSPEPSRVDFAAMDALPPIVQRFFRRVLPDGQHAIAAASFRHEGELAMRIDGGGWKTFTSQQRVVVTRPGFVWDASVQAMPGLAVRVHDAYVGGVGILEARFAGCVRVARLVDDGEVARGELMRWLAAAVWYPTALLPGNGVTWAPAGERAAVATVRDGGVEASLRFAFNADGLVETVDADARSRFLNGRMVATPWLGRFARWAARAANARSARKIHYEAPLPWALPLQGPSGPGSPKRCHRRRPYLVVAPATTSTLWVAAAGCDGRNVTASSCRSRAKWSGDRRPGTCRTGAGG